MNFTSSYRGDFKFGMHWINNTLEGVIECVCGHQFSHQVSFRNPRGNKKIGQKEEFDILFHCPNCNELWDYWMYKIEDKVGLVRPKTNQQIWLDIVKNETVRGN